MSLKVTLVVLAVYSVSTAFAAPPGFSVNRQAPPGFSVNRQAPPGFSVNRQAPPGFSVNRQAPPGFSVNRQAPPGLSVNRQAPPGLSVNRQAPPGFSVNRQEASCDHPCLLCALSLQSGKTQQWSLRGHEKREAVTTEESCLDVCSLCYRSVLTGQKKAVNSFASEEQVLPVCDHCFLCEQLQEYVYNEVMEHNSPAAKEQLFPLRSSNQQSKGDDFLSLERVAVPTPPPGKREAEGKCIDVCGECSATKEKKAREEAVINTILEILLSQ